MPDGCKEAVFRVFCVCLWLEDTEYFDLADKLVNMLFRMLYCPVYEKGANGQLLSPTAAIRSRCERFLGGDWVGLWEDANNHPMIEAQSRPRPMLAPEAEAY